YLQQQYVCQRITHADMYALIALPPGVDKAEWLASNSNLSTCSLQKQVECIYIVCYLIARHVSVSVLVLNCHLFLVSPGAKFPTGFVFMVQKVFLLLFRTMAHIYWSHYTQAQQVGLHPHLNTLFMHLTLFCRHHELLDPEDTEPLQDLITALGRQGIFSGLWFIISATCC
uniref:Si:dkey-266m15.5 n=1 Tax=Astatotilapia calliptera TaxID=8154 RepID=A0A3P8R032_ASTCA